MATTRTIIGTLKRLTGAPWANANVTFTLEGGSFTTSDQFPQDSITVLTDSTGAFSVDL